MTVDYTNVEIPRDRWGRPMVKRDGSDKRVAYRRVTTFVGAADDTYGLTQWKLRMAAIGMGQRPDLVVAAAACKPDNKKTLNDITEKAIEHAQASAAATTGTALHSFTEALDRGETLGHVPAPYDADLRAYEHATKGMEHVAIERFSVFDDWQVAGTADRIVRWHGELYVADVKSGNIDFAHKIAAQIALYSRSQPYDIATDTRLPRDPDINLSKGLIIHLPAGQARCDLHWVDLEAGWRGCQIAKTIWDWRGHKGLTWPVADTDIPDPRPTPATWESLAAKAATTEQLRTIWTRANECGELSADLRQLLTDRSLELHTTK